MPFCFCSWREECAPASHDINIFFFFLKYTDPVLVRNIAFFSTFEISNVIFLLKKSNFHGFSANYWLLRSCHTERKLLYTQVLEVYFGNSRLIGHVPTTCSLLETWEYYRCHLYILPVFPSLSLSLRVSVTSLPKKGKKKRRGKQKKTLAFTDLLRLQLRKVEHRSPELFLSINPFGFLPMRTKITRIRSSGSRSSRFLDFSV